MAKNKFYAVKIGKVPGIYNSWSECENQVKGFSNAKFKSFSTLEEAEEFMGTFKSTSTENDLNDIINVYVDGSYNSTTNEFGYACFIEFSDYKQIICGRGICEENGRNVEGEVSAAIAAIKYLCNETKPIIIYHDYEGVGFWPDKKWKANKSYSKAYANFVNMHRSNGMNITFTYVPSHSNVKGNELVDKLAKLSCRNNLSNSDINYISQYKNIDGMIDINSLPKLDKAWIDKI